MFFYAKFMPEKEAQNIRKNNLNKTFSAIFAHKTYAKITQLGKLNQIL